MKALPAKSSVHANTPRVGIPLLQLLVAQADTKTLMMSRRNCHANGVSSIVLSRDGDKLTRAFLAWPGHPLASNTLHGDMAVGFHTHRYPVALRLIAGEVLNHEADNEKPPKLWGIPEYRRLNEFSYETSKLTKSSQDGPKLLGETWLKRKASYRLGMWHWTSLEARRIHTISCEGPAAWLVSEGEVESDSCRLFSPRTEIDTEGFYQPFDSVLDVVKHLEEFYALFDA